MSISQLLKNDYTRASLVGVSLTAISVLLALAFGWVDSVNGFEVGATVLNYASFYLCVKQKRAYYLIGIVGYLFFIVVYLQANLLASTALSAYLSIALIAGFFMWRKDNNTLPVTRVAWKWWPVYIVVTVVAYAGAVAIVSALGGSFAFWDAIILVFTILAQLLLDRKKIENWAIWIVFVNGAGTILYFTMGLYLVAIQQLLFGLFSVWGWYEWRQSRLKDIMKNHPAGRDMRMTPVNNPLDYREDGSIQPGDPAYDFMMEVFNSGSPAIANQRNDGTWKTKKLDNPDNL